MTTNWHMDLHYYWLFILLLAFAVLAFVVWQRRFFLSFAAFSSIFVFLFVSFLWIRDISMSDGIGLVYNVVSPKLSCSNKLTFGSGQGGLSLRFIRTQKMDMLKSDDRPPNTVRFVYTKSTSPTIQHYPSLPERPGSGQRIYWKRWGFSIGVINEADHPKQLTWAHFYGVVVPNWFVLPFTLFFPAIWLRRYLRLRHRVRTGLCLNCGYDLRESKDKCPECGVLFKKPVVGNLEVQQTPRKDLVS